MTTSWLGVKYNEIKITINTASVPWCDRWHAFRLWKNPHVPRASDKKKKKKLFKGDYNPE